MKKIIINADDFGYSVNKNEAIKYGFQSGVITSSSIITNMDGFYQAINEVLEEIPFIDLGFHFNISEGKSLTNPSLLTDKNGYFNRSYFEIMIESSGKKFQKQIEAEFRAQLEKILEYKYISHVDSHMHIHAIPHIFSLISDLSKEYNIPFIRTQHEIPYKTHSVRIKCINIVKNILLNSFTAINKHENKNINTNDYLIGVLFTGRMTKETIFSGLKKINNDNSITEIIIHPSIDFNLKSKRKLNRNHKEFEILSDTNFRQKLLDKDYFLTSFCYL